MRWSVEGKRSLKPAGAAAVVGEDVVGGGGGEFVVARDGHDRVTVAHALVVIGARLAEGHIRTPAGAAGAAVADAVAALPGPIGVIIPAGAPVAAPVVGGAHVPA